MKQTNLPPKHQPLEQTTANALQTNTEHSIVAKHRPVQRQQPQPYTSGHTPIKAKQQPIQRKANKAQQIVETMGNQYGVDTSVLQLKTNSPLPDSLDADASINGRQIDFAPGKDTEHNIKHEVAHYIINTRRGATPHADATINGQAVNTSDEAAAEQIARTPLQRITAGKSTTQPKKFAPEGQGKNVFQLTRKRRQKRGRKRKKEKDENSDQEMNSELSTPKKEKKRPKKSPQTQLKNILANDLGGETDPSKWTFEQVKNASNHLPKLSRHDKVNSQLKNLYYNIINTRTQHLKDAKGKRSGTLGFTKEAAKDSKKLNPNEGSNYATRLLTNPDILKLRKTRIDSSNKQNLRDRRQELIRQIDYPDMEPEERHAMGLGDDAVIHSYYDGKQAPDDYRSLTLQLDRAYPTAQERRDMITTIANQLGLSFGDQGKPSGKKIKIDKYARQFASIQMVEKGRENEIRGGREDRKLVEKAMLEAISKGFTTVYKEGQAGGFAASGGKKWYTKEYNKKLPEKKAKKKSEKKSKEKKSSSSSSSQQLPGRLVNVSGNGMDCLIRAILRATTGNIDESLVTTIREHLVNQGVTQQGSMLDLAGTAGGILISYLAGLSILHPNRGIVVYLPGANPITVVAGNNPINLWLSGNHFQAII